MTRSARTPRARAVPLATLAGRARVRIAVAVALLGTGATACGGGAPLLHPARTMAGGDVRLVTGVAANVAAGALSEDLRRAREIVAQDPQAPGLPGATSESATAYAKGALVAAAVAPGLSPVIAARVGVGSRFEGGLTYTGRAVRADLRRSFDDGPWSLSVGLGLSAALSGRQQGGVLSGVDLGALRGYGADVPVLVGWESAGGLYKLYGGPRGGFERVTIESVTSEPRDVVLGGAPIRLEADRFFAGAAFGFATGFRHVHVALEVAAAYQVVSGTFNASDATVRGLTLTPASAVWTTF